MESNKQWPAWRYDQETGEGRIFNHAAEVSEGWEATPPKTAEGKTSDEYSADMQAHRASSPAAFVPPVVEKKVEVKQTPGVEVKPVTATDETVKPSASTSNGTGNKEAEVEDVVDKKEIKKSADILENPFDSLTIDA